MGPNLIIQLGGCTPEPLANYLKALGGQRVVTEQADPTARGRWQQGCFSLETRLSEADLIDFFLTRYRPTPLVAPWNGSTGFYKKDNQKTLNTIRNSKAERLQHYRDTVGIAQAQVDKLALLKQPGDLETKKQLMTRLRNTLSDEAIQWIDTCASVTSADLSFPPLTGTGGNDGNFEFSRTFMQQLQEIIDFDSGEPTANSPQFLQAALFSLPVPGLRFTGKIGQFNPIAAGGANAGPGYDANSRVNPWDFVLMLEGILLFTAGFTRRHEQASGGSLSYPFMVRPSTVGYGSAALGDSARAELWAPLWSTSMSLVELQSFFREGRAKISSRSAQDKVSSRPARDGVDFARAVATLGVNRDIDAFTRYSFQERNGLSYFAIPLGQFKPSRRQGVDLLANPELDGWLQRLQAPVRDDKTPASIKMAHRKLESAIVALTQGQGTVLDVLTELGAMEASLDQSLKFTLDKKLKPVPALSKQWITECREVDQSVEFKLALALASQNLRSRLTRVRPTKRHRNWEWAENDDGLTIWQQGGLTKNLIALVKRMDIEAQQARRNMADSSDRTMPDSNRQPRIFADLPDIAHWLAGDIDDERLEAIAQGLSLVNLAALQTSQRAKPIRMPTSFAVLAPAHHRSFTYDDRLYEIPYVPGMVSKLASGKSGEATKLAIRRLRASGLPVPQLAMQETSDFAQRLAAALAFPVHPTDLEHLLKQLLPQNN